MRRLWRNYSLGIVYLVGWLSCWALHAVGVWAETTLWEHGQSPWWIEWFAQSFENLASEYHQVGAFIVLSKLYVFKGSPQSRDGDDERDARLERIERALRAIQVRFIEQQGDHR